MDLTLINKVENGEFCYKLFRSTFYKGYYVIIAQTKKEFYCGSFVSSKDGAEKLFLDICETATEPYCIADILSDFQKQMA